MYIYFISFFLFVLFLLVTLLMDFCILNERVFVLIWSQFSLAIAKVLTVFSGFWHSFRTGVTWTLSLPVKAFRFIRLIVISDVRRRDFISTFRHFDIFQKIEKSWQETIRFSEQYRHRHRFLFFRYSDVVSLTYYRGRCLNILIGKWMNANFYEFFKIS